MLGGTSLKYLLTKLTVFCPNDKFGNIQSTRGKSVDAETLARRWDIDHKEGFEYCAYDHTERSQNISVPFHDLQISNKR